MINFRYYRYACMAARLAGKNINPDWIYAQWAHETNNFTSDLCLLLNNCAGLTQLSENAYPQPDGNLYYMCFDCLSDFADYFGSYLGYYEIDGIFDAYSLHDYIAALHRGGYFTDTFENYMEGVEFYYAETQAK